MTTEDQSVYQKDYDITHSDVIAAKKLEPYFHMLNIFRTQDPKFMVLILAGARTIASSRAGFFSISDVDSLLTYMTKANRNKVFKYLRNHKWIVHNGLEYEMPTHIRALLSHLMSSFVRGESTIAQNIQIMIAETSVMDHYNLDETDRNEVFRAHMSGLALLRNDMERTLRKRDFKTILQLLKDSKALQKAIKDAKEIIRLKENTLSSGGIHLHRLYDIASEIGALLERLLDASIESAKNNIGAIGKSITSEDIDEFLKKTPIYKLADIAEANLPPPKQPIWLHEEQVAMRAASFLERRPEIVEPTPPPAIADLPEEDMDNERARNPLEELYQELLFKMNDIHSAPLNELLFPPDSDFGQAMHRTGQTVRLTLDLAKTKEKRDPCFVMDVSDEFTKIELGPVLEMNKTTLLKEEQNIWKTG
ncbi:hypothetical protein GJ688_18815 [Heliobacillus mobilis]|uniref:Uncharacterized protein n=1 Tax=Heliobacterium mobile TaxID=28064 RepID=A0A6I3SRH1_HELMO|nr:hypothetical protein [Heliobacterium mobile]MTV50972.1 hypothetical protein [Heliobacterium mobile]